MTALRLAQKSGRKAGVPNVAPRQEPLSDWPKRMLDVTFTVKGDLGRLSEHLGIELESGSDNLDDYEAALVNINLAGQVNRVGFQSYSESPRGTFNVLAERISEPLIEYLVIWLGVTADTLDWASPEVEPKLRRALSRRKSFHWLSSFKRLQLRRSNAVITH